MVFPYQIKYDIDILVECGLSGAKLNNTPMEQQHKLAEENGDFFESWERYRCLVGRFSTLPSQGWILLLRSIS